MSDPKHTNKKPKPKTDLTKLLNLTQKPNRTSQIDYHKCIEQIKQFKIQLKKEREKSLNSLKKHWDNTKQNNKDQQNQKVPTLTTRITLKGHFGKIYALSWMKKGKHIVSASQDGKLMVN